jgi:hypothetical protein
MKKLVFPLYYNLDLKLGVILNCNADEHKFTSISKEKMFQYEYTI